MAGAEEHVVREAVPRDGQVLHRNVFTPEVLARTLVGHPAIVPR
jgi:hypothetical protein